MEERPLRVSNVACSIHDHEHQDRLTISSMLMLLWHMSSYSLKHVGVLNRFPLQFLFVFKPFVNKDMYPCESRLRTFQGKKFENDQNANRGQEVLSMFVLLAGEAICIINVC